MIRLNDALLNTKLELIKEENYKVAFSEAIQVKLWLVNRNAYGVAANQLGINHHFFVAHNYKRHGLPTDVFFNASYEPENPDQQFMSEEWCLSYPGRKFVVMRFPKIHMKYYDPREKKFKECFLDGKASIVAQHEIGHLNGITDEMEMKILTDKMAEAKKSEEKVTEDSFEKLPG
jgi:peptide deformylase